MLWAASSCSRVRERITSNKPPGFPDVPSEPLPQSTAVRALTDQAPSDLGRSLPACMAVRNGHSPCKQPCPSRSQAGQLCSPFPRGRPQLASSCCMVSPSVGAAPGTDLTSLKMTPLLRSREGQARATKHKAKTNTCLVEALECVWCCPRTPGNRRSLKGAFCFLPNSLSTLASILV